MTDEEKARAERAEGIRKQLKHRVPKGDRRKAAQEIGVSNTALGDFIDGRTGPPLDGTLDKYEAWLSGSVRPDRVQEERTSYEPAAGSRDLARQIDQVLRLPGDWMEKTFFMAELSAAYRARAMDTAERRAMLRERRRPTGPAGGVIQMAPLQTLPPRPGDELKETG